MGLAAYAVEWGQREGRGQALVADRVDGSGGCGAATLDAQRPGGAQIQRRLTLSVGTGWRAARVVRAAALTHAVCRARPPCLPPPAVKMGE